LNSCGVQYDANAAGVSDVQLGDKQAFSNLDFTEVWEMSNQGFPILKNNPVQKYMDGLTDIHKPVKNLKVEGYSYKSIKLTWDPVENAKEYLIVSQKAPWNRYVVTRDTSFVDDDLQSQGKPLKSVKYYVIPVFNHNDMDFYGTHAAYGIGSPVDVESESSYTDYVYPEYVGMRVLTEKAYKPGLVEVEVSAKDLDSGISSITVELSIPFDYDLPGFSHTMNFSGEKEVTTVVKVPVPLGVKSGNYKVTSIKITDMAGNTDGPSYQGYFGGEQLADSSIYIDDEFDVEFTGALSNASVPSQLKNMAEGKTVVLKINEKSKGILKKEILDASKGQDKTVVVYADDNASMQWVFYGKDITGTTKDININVKVEKVSGNRFGSKFDVIKLEYADNGKLPGLIQFRLKSNYISAINNSKEDLFLYYDNGKELSLEQSNCPIIKDGKSNWCYMDLGHNSTFYLSSEELTKYAGVKFKGTVKLSKSEYVYTGGAKNPKLTVKTSDGKTLKQGKDYTVSTPKGRKAIGKYTYTVKFKGNYSGTNTVTLMIKPKAPTIKTPTASKKAITVKWKNVKKSQATGYQVMVATDKNFTKNVKKSFVKGYSKASKKMTKLKAKTKYFVKVRTYKTVKGIKIYSDWSKVKQIKTK